MSAFPSLPLFTDAFIADTGHLSAQETGAYLMLLMVAWRSQDCRLPDDDDRLARWARVDRRTWLRIKRAVMEFWDLADGHWTQKRLTKERVHVSKRADAARENGKHGGRPKSLKSQEQENPTGSARVSGSKAPNPNPNPSIQEEDEPLPETRAGRADAGGGASPRSDFEAWWRAYPHKVGKDAARAAFERVRRSGRVPVAALHAGLARYVAAKPPDRPWCNPATWLNQGRWADEPAEPPIRAGPAARPESAQAASLRRAREAHLRLTAGEHDPDPDDPFAPSAPARPAGGGPGDRHPRPRPGEPAGGWAGLAPPLLAGPSRPH